MILNMAHEIMIHICRNCTLPANPKCCSVVQSLMLSPIDVPSTWMRSLPECGQREARFTIRCPYWTMSYKASLVATDLLLVPALHSIFVLNLRLIYWKATERAPRPRAVSKGTSLAARFAGGRAGLISA